MPELLARQDAANRLGVHFSKLERLRLKGLIPEAIKVGRCYVFPGDQIDTIKARLVAQGHIRPAKLEVDYAA